MKNTNIKQLIRSFVFSLSALFSANNYAIDVDPRDYIAAPPGTNLAILYGGYINEHNNLGAGLNAQINIARFVFYREIFGITVDPQILIPFGSQEIDINGVGAIETSGIADPIFAATFWFVNNEKHQFAITPFVTLPIGSYDNEDPINLGTNTYTGILQAGWVYKPIPQLALEVVADVTFSTDNDDFGASRQRLDVDNAYQLQLLASYNLNDKAAIGANFSRQIGADTELEAESIMTPGADITKLSLYGQYWLAPSLQLQAKYTRDLNVKNVPFESQTFQLRVIKIF